MRPPLFGLVALLGSGCGAFAPNEEPTAAEASTARPIPIASTALASSTHEQAVRALAADAWRREARFMDAADPGFAFRSTRVTSADLDAGRFEPEELYQLGAALFSFTFTPEIGFGAADLPAFSRFHREQRGGPDANRCADCHWRGGIAGAGDAADNAFFRGDGFTEASSLVRNPPSLVGAGWREILAAQMSADLQAQRDELAMFAREAGYGVRVELATQGVSFGFLSAEADGTLNTDDLEGIDADLVVKPFGWKGTFSTLRDVVEDALLVHHGMQSTHVVRNEPTERIGDGPADDPDADGVVDEVTEGQVNALTLFIAMQEVPVDQPPDQNGFAFQTEFVLEYARGRNQFVELGCADCHTPSWEMHGWTFDLPARDEGGAVSVNLLEDAAEPRLQPDPVTGALSLPVYSDLKRHHMGAALAEPRSDAGLAADLFVTPPLWGIARSRPYLHDARAPTLEDAILLHGGEAQASADAFGALEESDRRALRIFLTALTRAPRLISP